MNSKPISDALDQLRVEFPSGRALIDDLQADTAFAIASTDLDEVLVRILELVSNDDLGDRHAYEAFDLLVAAQWTEWDMPAVQAVSVWADAVWLTALMSDPAEADAGDVLGNLVHLGLPMVRWLPVWINELDGPGAEHLANFLIDGSDDPGWEGRADEKSQVVGWARTEAVVNGFMIIGGVHLEPGRFAKVLDQIIVAPGLSPA